MRIAINRIFSKFLTRSWAIAALLLIGCSSPEGQHVYIELDNQRLAEIPSGEWLRHFDTSYSNSPDRIKKQITDQLNRDGVVVREYMYEEGANTVKATELEFRGSKFTLRYYSGGIWEGPEIIPWQEYQGGWNSWITYHPAKPIPYSVLIPKRYAELADVRAREHAVTVKSAKDEERRLFLFGYGDQCEYITLH